MSRYVSLLGLRCSGKGKARKATTPQPANGIGWADTLKTFAAQKSAFGWLRGALLNPYFPFRIVLSREHAARRLLGIPRAGPKPLYPNASSRTVGNAAIFAYRQSVKTKYRHPASYLFGHECTHSNPRAC